MMIQLLISLLLLGDGPGVYGKGVQKETLQLTIETLMANPEQYLDKVVKVEGTVKEVCPMAGCWLDLDGKNASVRIKVKDGEIVFDKDLTGKKIMAEGTVYKFDLSKDEAVKYFKHLAEEKGESFDPSSVTAGTTIYQIGGIGAMVLN